MILVQQPDGQDYVAVGSANASSNAASRNYEAVLLSDTDTSCDAALGALNNWRAQATKLNDTQLRALCNLYDDSHPNTQPVTDDGDPATATEPTAADTAEKNDGPLLKRPPSVYLVPIFHADEASEEAILRTQQLIDEYEVTDTTNAEPGEAYIEMFWDESSSVLQEGWDVILVDRASQTRRPRPNANVYAPGRIIHTFHDTIEDPPRVYYYLLGTASPTEVLFQQLVDALAAVGSEAPTGNRTDYHVRDKVNAILNLWPERYGTVPL